MIKTSKFKLEDLDRVPNGIAPTRDLGTVMQRDLYL